MIWGGHIYNSEPVEVLQIEMFIPVDLAITSVKEHKKFSTQLTIKWLLKQKILIKKKTSINLKLFDLQDCSSRNTFSNLTSWQLADELLNWRLCHLVSQSALQEQWHFLKKKKKKKDYDFIRDDLIGC